MNTKNLLKTGILACAMVFSISNNSNATTCHTVTVNDKVFQHDVTIIGVSSYYEYRMPKRKTYVKNNNTKCLEEMNNTNHSDEQYIKCTDGNNEYCSQSYNCIMQLYYNPTIMRRYGNIYKNYKNSINNNIIYKFNKLYEKSKTSCDAITSFENAVRKLFGNDYKVTTNLDDVLSQYPENFIQVTKQNGTTENFIKKNSEYFSSNQLYEILENNNMQLVATYKNYQWKGTAEDEKGEKKKFDARIAFYRVFKGDVLIITNGKNVICYDKLKREIRIYEKLNYFQRKQNININKNFIEKFNKLGLLLQKKYEAELKLVKEVFGQDFDLSYK